MMLDTLALAVSTLTATVGLFVAYQAFRGYRRNASPKMRALASAIVLIAVVPYLAIHGVTAVVALTDAQVLVVVLGSHTLGLAAIYRSLD